MVSPAFPPTPWEVHRRGGLGPGGMGEGDPVQLGPGGEDPLLGDEAVVVALAAVLILDVGDTLVRPLGLIVVVGHALEAGPLAGAEQMGAVRAQEAPAGPGPSSS